MYPFFFWFLNVEQQHMNIIYKYTYIKVDLKILLMIGVHNEKVERPHAYSMKSQSLRFMCKAFGSLDPACMCLDSPPSLFPLIPAS